MKVTEEFLNVIGLKDRTTGKGVIKYVKNHQLDLKNLISVATEGALSIIGKYSAAVTLILRDMGALKECPSSEREMFKCHCFFTPGKVMHASSGHVPRYYRCSHNC